MKLSGHTIPFAVLGHPIGHTLSPVMHNAAIRSMDMDAIYLAFDVQPESLLSTLNSMKIMGFKGVNLTVPLKETGFEGIENLDISADRLGAVNTVKFLPGGIKGYNTDGAGFLRAIGREFNLSLENSKILIVGTGGAGRAVALTSAAHGAAEIILSDINQARCEKLKTEIRQTATCNVNILAASGPDMITASADADLIVQATPVGMKKEDKSIIPAEAFRNNQKVFDLVYMYPETDLMRIARSKGALAANGLSMLMYQGAEAFEIWTGIKPPEEAMLNALKKEVYK